MKKLLTICILLLCFIPSSNAQINPIRYLDYDNHIADTIIYNGDTLYNFNLDSIPLYDTIGYEYFLADTFWTMSMYSTDTTKALFLIADTSSSYYDSMQDVRILNPSGTYLTYMQRDSMKVYNEPFLFWEYGYMVTNIYAFRYEYVYLNQNKKRYDAKYVIWENIILY